MHKIWCLNWFKTANFTCISIFVLIFAADASFNNLLGYVLGWIGFVLFVAATVLTIWSGISYVLKNKQVLKDN